MKKPAFFLIVLIFLGLTACKPEEPTVSDAILEKKALMDKAKAAVDQGAETSRQMLDARLEQDVPPADPEGRTTRNTEE